MFGKSRSDSRQKIRLASVGIALLALLLISGAAHATFAAGPISPPGPQAPPKPPAPPAPPAVAMIQLTNTSLNWALVQMPGPKGANNIQVTISSWQLSSNQPQNLQVQFWVTYQAFNSSAISTYFTQNAPLNFPPAHLFSSTTINAPFNGAGEYTFYAKFNSGRTVIAQLADDPKIEPEF